VNSRALLALMLLAGMSPGVHAEDVVRRASPGFPISSSVTVPGGSEIVFLSGMLADAADARAAAGSIERLGDTATQTKSVLGKIQKELEAIGLGMQDVVKMNVFLVGDPRRDNTMDFEGLMKGYLQFFGTEEQPNVPARTTVQVAGLPIPGALVEIEVVVARRGRQ